MFREFSSGPVVRTGHYPSWALSSRLVGELRSHKPRGATPKKKKKIRLRVFILRKSNVCQIDGEIDSHIHT